mmetsp:Transcript_18785/g.36028  ORF Transcript_18785/g.36028 Transcript_18785/m.36028 type:complete len:470 (+) Transcript_18785:193-1602(+)
MASSALVYTLAVSSISVRQEGMLGDRSHLWTLRVRGGWISPDSFSEKATSIVNRSDATWLGGNLTFDEFVDEGGDVNIMEKRSHSSLPNIENLKFRPYRTEKEKLRRKLERRLRRKPKAIPEEGHEDDQLFDSDFSQTSMTSDTGAMWTSEAALSTDNSDTDRGPDREGGLAFDHLVNSRNQITPKRVNKMMRRLNITDPWIQYRNIYSCLPQMSSKPYIFTKDVHMIDSLSRLRDVVSMSAEQGQPNVTMICFITYHIKYRQQCKLIMPSIDEYTRDQRHPCITGIVDVGKHPELVRASGVKVQPYFHFYVQGQKKYEFGGAITMLMDYYLQQGNEDANPESTDSDAYFLDQPFMDQPTRSQKMTQEQDPGYDGPVLKGAGAVEYERKVEPPRFPGMPMGMTPQDNEMRRRQLEEEAAEGGPVAQRPVSLEGLASRGRGFQTPDELADQERTVPWAGDGLDDGELFDV